jgi:DNA modification methylase
MRHGNGKRGRPDGYNPRRDAKVIGYKHNDLIPIPWLVAIALQKDGWWLRNDCILEKVNVMPYTGEDRCAMSHEYILLLAKSERYYFDYQAIMEPADPKYTERYACSMPGYPSCKRPNGKADTQNGMREFQEMRRMRSVWSLPTQGYPGHPAAFSERLAEICVLAGSRVGDVILDPFSGSGTVAAVSQRLGRNSIAIELVSSYITLIEERCNAIRAPQDVSAELAA